VSKAGKGKRVQQDEEVFGDDILRELDELLQNEPATAPRKPAPPTSTRSSDQPVTVPPPKLKGDPETRRKAQELASQARNAQDQKQALRFAREALKLDRNCVDGWVVLAHAKATAPDELAENLEAAVRRGEQGLGKEHIEHYRGKLWSMVEARPYMQARRELADVLRDMGHIDKAIGHYEALMDLDASDSQRNRDSLVGCYLAVGYVEAAKRVLDRFAGDTSAAMAWSRVMERYLAHDLAGAMGALATARQVNRWVEDYLVGRKPMPQHTLSDSTQGGDYEARHCAAGLLPALVQHPRFAVWLGAKQAKP